jgi:hypothetical protein
MLRCPNSDAQVSELGQHPRLLLLASVFRLGKAARPLHRSATNPRTMQILSIHYPERDLFQHFLSAMHARSVQSGLQGDEVHRRLFLGLLHEGVRRSGRWAHQERVERLSILFVLLDPPDPDGKADQNNRVGIVDRGRKFVKLDWQGIAPNRSALPTSHRCFVNGIFSRSRPRARKRIQPMALLMMPQTGSTVCFCLA